GIWGGVLASFFFMFLPYNIYFTRVILPEPMATALALGSVWYFIKFINAEKQYALYLSGVLLALSLLIKPFTIFYTPPLVYLALEKYGWEGMLKNAKKLIPFMIFADIVFVPFLLWRGWISMFPEGIPFFTWAFNGDRIRFRPAFWRWLFAERIGKLFLGVWGLIPFSLGLLTTKKKDLFNLLFFLGGVLYMTAIATANVRHDYYQIFIIPMLVLPLAKGTIYLWETKTFSHWISRPLVVFSILMMLMLGTYQVKEYYKINHPEIIEAGRAIDRLTPKDSIVVAPYNGDTAFLYQTGRWGWPAIDDSIDRIIEKGADYYVSVNIGDTDTQMIIKRFEILERTNNYLIADLHKPIKP
ncbi:MAG: glycosyltransferase family 39 protein, partial [bacterium]|nr:glycosyltransferase family 39 protein [bacterium]